VRVHFHRWRSFVGVGDRDSAELPWIAGLSLNDFVPSDLVGRHGLTMHHNGSLVPAEGWASCPISPGDHVDVSVRPAGPLVIPALVSAAVGAAVSFVVSLILPKPKGPKKRGDDESPTYAWSGKDNVRVEGQPRTVIYGEMRVAPQVLDSFVRTTTVPAQSTLYLLLGFGEGPIEAIGDRTTDSPAGAWLQNVGGSEPLPTGIEIDGNPLENFRGVRAQVRLGTHEQNPLIGFEQIHTLSAVGQTLTQAETSASHNGTVAWDLAAFPYNSNNATIQAIWTLYAQAFTLPSAADSIVATIDFPEGLYRLDSSGNLQDAYFQAIVRYRELDGAGTPITTGGDNGDGWVYRPPTPLLISHHQGPFPYEFASQLYSSAGFVAGTPGSILNASTVGTYAYTSASNGGAAANASTPWTAGAAIDGFTVEGWYNPASLPMTGSDITRPIFEWATFAAGVYRGVSMQLKRETADMGTGGLVQRWRLNVHVGAGAATFPFVRDLGLSGGDALQANFSAGAWAHIAFTYKRNAIGSADRIRIYINGALRFEVANGTVAEMVAPLAPMLLLRTALTPVGPANGVGKLDEWRVWSVERTPTQVQDSYDFGRGTFGAPSTDLVAGWHFDSGDILTAYTFSNDYGSRNNDVTTSGAATMGDPSAANQGPVYGGGAGTLTRARYLIQLMRFNLKSTSAFIGDRSEWTSVDGIIEEELAYPYTPVLALAIPATDQLNTTEPRVTARVKGRKVPVWNGLSTIAPTITEAWNANPGWVCHDMLLNRRYGRGGSYKADLVSLKQWADYCDEKIYDAKGSVAIHSTTSSFAISNLRYNSTLFSSYGGIEISFRTGFVPPAHWIIGGFLGFVGIAAPPTSGISVDLNAISGFEIGSMVFASSAWTVTVKYDKATLTDPWLDGAFLSTVINPTAVTGSVQGREVRFRFDGAFDTFGKAWDQLLLVAGSARATPALEGRTVRFRVARPRGPVGLVTMASIKPGSFSLSYTGPTERPNAYVADFLDADRNWQRATAERLAPGLEIAAPEGAFNRDNVELFGITRRSQALRDLDFRLQVNDLLVRQGEFETGLEALPYESGDVVTLAHDLVPWGKSGRFDQVCTGTSMFLDRSIVLAAATTYYLRVRSNSLGQSGSGQSTQDFFETRTVSATAGTYAAGASISIASAFSFDPQPNDPYVLYSDAEAFLAEIAEVTMSEDYSRTVTWIEYRAAVYDVDTLPHDIPGDLQFAISGPPTFPDSHPAPVKDLTLAEQQSRDASGSWIPEIRASWRLDPATAEHVAEVIVMGRAPGADGFDELARLRGPATSAILRPSGAAPGTQYEITVQPITTTGKRAAPLLCSSGSVEFVGLNVAPPAPTNLRATMDGEHIVYQWDPPADARGLSYELRRGGWVLGQVVGIAPPGSYQIGPTRNWSASKNNALGAGPPPLVLRARDGRGHVSAAVRLEGFQPAVLGAEAFVPASLVGSRINDDQRWEDFGGFWTGGSPSTVLTGVEKFTIPDGRLVLRFNGANLTGTYETSIGAVDANVKPEHAYIEAFATADQVAPITLEQILLPLESPIASRRTLEGSAAYASGEPTGCTLKIEWRYKQSGSGSYTDWMEFEPGIYFVAVPQFRLSVTRPDTTWDLWIYSFGTRITRPARPKFLRTDAHRDIERGQASLG